MKRTKKNSAAKAKSKKSELKEFRFGPNIGEGDLQIRIKRAREFLEDGNTVKITVQLRGREKSFPEVAVEKLQYIEKGLEDVARVEGGIKKEPSDIRATFVKK